MKQNEAVKQTIENLGGFATLGQLYEEVMKITDCTWKTTTPFASIRRIVQVDKDIYKIKPGLYGLKKFLTKNEDRGAISDHGSNKNSKEINEFNHSYYQGILINVGKLKGFQTIIPNQDKNKKFIDKKLCDLQNLENLPSFTYPHLVKRCSSIDVIWFNERMMPHSFFEIEYSTDIQNSLLKYNDLQDFYTRMLIVADSSRKDEYLKKIKYSSFKNLIANNRVNFLDYESLVKQYESLLQQSKYEVIL
ncbi:MAG: hypothetical protein WCI71_13625 [Bacteroidota bacterium]